MGEFINNVKLGTCESLYYTTFEQLKNWKITNPEEKAPYLKIDSGFLFRFPFPDENIQIGHHEDFDRGFRIELPKELKIDLCHGSVFHRIGENMPHHEKIGVEIPCPYGEDCKNEVRFYSNDKIIFEIVQQKFTTQQGGENLVTVVRCPYCKQRCQLSELEVIEAINYISTQMKLSEENKKYYEMTFKVLDIALAGYSG